MSFHWLEQDPMLEAAVQACLLARMIETERDAQALYTWIVSNPSWEGDPLVQGYRHEVFDPATVAGVPLWSDRQGDYTYEGFWLRGPHPCLVLWKRWKEYRVGFLIRRWDHDPTQEELSRALRYGDTRDPAYVICLEGLPSVCTVDREPVLSYQWRLYGLPDLRRDDLWLLGQACAGLADIHRGTNNPTPS